jgi:hypothetical protein
MENRREKLLGRPRCRWEGNSKMDRKEIGLLDVGLELFGLG